MKLSDYVIDFLKNSDVKYIFEVCGGALAHILDSMYDQKDISCVSMHHEQAAAFAAEGYARVTGGLGVAMATSGPGATNLVTGVGSCFFDSVPSLFITGQVNTYEFKFDRDVRQVGFQETDIVNIVKPVVKYSALVDDAEKIRYHLEKAIHLAHSGRPGPVLLDLPLNVQRTDVDPDSLEPYDEGEADMLSDVEDDGVMQPIVDAIKGAERPVILCGAGVRIGKATGELKDIVDRTGIPVVTTLLGKDGFPHDAPPYAGMIGTYGNRFANLAIANADLVLILGARLDTRQTGTKPETFAREARIIHVDIDISELNNKLQADFAVNADTKTFLKSLQTRLTGYDPHRLTAWRDKIDDYKNRYPSYDEPGDREITPNYLLKRLSELIPEDSVICVDVGQNQMWSAQSMMVKEKQRFMTQGGMGAMGSALSMGIGSAYAAPGKTIVVVTGDGGFQLNTQELETVSHHKLPIKIVLLNNGCYGMVRQFQEQYFESRFQSTVVGYSSPDFQTVVPAYGVAASKIEESGEIDGALKRLLVGKDPAFLEVMIDPKNQVNPKLGLNKPVEDQDPPLSREELRSNMIVEPLEEQT